MAHVQISQGDHPTTLKIVIDGVDMSRHIYDQGFGLVKVGAPGEWEAQRWGVQMIIAADSLDLDLPDAVIQAVAKSRDEMMSEAI